MYWTNTMTELDAYFSTAIRARRVSLGLSLPDASQRTLVAEPILALAEERPTKVPLRAIVQLMEGYGAMEAELMELCCARPGVAPQINN
jgi:hypothetical protein